MDIQYYGHACFALKEGKTTILMDPFNESVGLKVPKWSADIVTISFNGEAHNNKAAVAGEPKVFFWPGEYETKGIHFRGIHSFHNHKDEKEQLENVIFTFNVSDIRFCHLGAQGTRLTPEQLEKVGEVDILFVPVGGKGCVDAKKAKEIIEQIEPRIVVPMMYDEDSLSAFLSVMGAEKAETVDKFTVKRSELPEDNSKVIVLTPTV